MRPQAQARAKRAGQPLGTHVNHVAGQKDKENFLLHVVDSRRNEKWLVDGGALLSIIPPSTHHLKAGPVADELRAANGTKIQCYGTDNRTLCIDGKDFPFEFTVAAVNQRILGADFLAHNYLAPNHRDAKLLNLKDFSTIKAQHAVGAMSTPVNFVTHANDPCYKLLDSYPELLTPTFSVKEPAHGVKHHIPTTGRPVQSKARRLDQEKLAVAKAELDKLVELGVCYRGRSEWSSPLMVTTKPCGGWRVCGDYRRLNSMTTDDTYPVRQLTDFTSELHGKKFFSKIDLLKGYHQIPVAEEDIGKTAVITPFGLFIFPCTPFGLKNAGQDFQRLMDEILGDVPRVFVYIDDILVASESLEQHLQDLDLVFKTLSANGMVVQRPKCILGQSSLEFLGYQVDSTGISPLKDRVAAIEQTKRPTSIKELQRFLGMVGYYRRFIPNAASHLYHLFDALKGKPKTLVWSPKCQASFEAIKEALAAATLLHHPRPGAALALTTDASNQAIGGVLEQRGPNGWEPLAFWSAKLEENQKQWPPYDRELLAAFRGTRHFRSWIEGRPFTLYTDHQSLVPSIHKKTDPQTLRQTYQLSCIAEFTTDIRYLEGKANVVADALSRPNEDTFDVHGISQGAMSSRQEKTLTTPSLDQPIFRNVQTETSFPTPLSTTSSTGSAASSSSTPVDATEDVTAANRSASTSKAEAAFTDLNCVVNAIGSLGLDWDSIATEQTLDPEFQRLRREARTGLNFKSVNIGDKSIIVDVSNGPARPYIPFSSRKKVFDCFHGLGHPGVERTRQAISEKVVWPSMRADVSKWARECISCQRSKVTRHTVPPIGEFEVPNKRFDHVNIDIVTLPVSNGFRYLLTMVDRFTRWPVAVPMVDATTQSVIDAFAFGWIQSFGVPHTLTSDRGPQFTSDTFQQLANIWGIKSIHTAPYHPEANGLVERFHRRLKEAINALGADEPEEWYWKLPMVMLTIRTTIKPDVGASPADLVYGEGLAVPGEALPTNPATEDQLVRQRAAALAEMRLEVARLQPVQTSAHRRPLVHLPDSLETCTHVFVRRGGVQSTLASPYMGPYKVISRNNCNFKVALPGRQHETVAIGRIKPAYQAIDDTADDRPPAPPTPSRPRAPRNPSRNPSRNRTRVDDEQPPPSLRNPPPANLRRQRSRRSHNEDPPVQPQHCPDEDVADDPLTFDFPHDDVPDWAPPDWFDADADPDRDAEAPRPHPSASPARSQRSRPHSTQRNDVDQAPLPPPPPRRRRDVRNRKSRRMGNPNWKKGGSFAGAYQRQYFMPDDAPQAEHPEPEATERPPTTPPREPESPGSRSPSGRRRPDVSALNFLVRQHLEVHDASTTPSPAHGNAHGFFPPLSGN